MIIVDAKTVLQFLEWINGLGENLRAPPSSICSSLVHNSSKFFYTTLKKEAHG
jgi:hypothetical protein